MTLKKKVLSAKAQFEALTTRPTGRRLHEMTEVQSTVSAVKKACAPLKGMAATLGVMADDAGEQGEDELDMEIAKIQAAVLQAARGADALAKKYKVTV